MTDRPSSHRWQRRKHARAGEILAAAAQIAAETGYNSLHMANIAARAGITKGTIYLYFTSKDELLQALAARRAPRGTVSGYRGGIATFTNVVIPGRPCEAEGEAWGGEGDPGRIATTVCQILR